MLQVRLSPSKMTTRLGSSRDESESSDSAARHVLQSVTGRVRAVRWDRFPLLGCLLLELGILCLHKHCTRTFIRSVLLLLACLQGMGTNPQALFLFALPLFLSSTGSGELVRPTVFLHTVREKAESPLPRARTCAPCLMSSVWLPY